MSVCYLWFGHSQNFCGGVPLLALNHITSVSHTNTQTHTHTHTNLQQIHRFTHTHQQITHYSVLLMPHDTK